jgi:Xaa-Pro aminopeptidase
LILNGGANYKYLIVRWTKRRDGTTVFTRTIHFGISTELEKEIYTRILKGILAVEATSFPEGTTGISMYVLTD